APPHDSDNLVPSSHGFDAQPSLAREAPTGVDSGGRARQGRMQVVHGRRQAIHEPNPREDEHDNHISGIHGFGRGLGLIFVDSPRLRVNLVAVLVHEPTNYATPYAGMYLETPACRFGLPAPLVPANIVARSGRAPGPLAARSGRIPGGSPVGPNPSAPPGPPSPPPIAAANCSSGLIWAGSTGSGGGNALARTTSNFSPAWRAAVTCTAFAMMSEGSCPFATICGIDCTRAERPWSSESRIASTAIFDSSSVGFMSDGRWRRT